MACPLSELWATSTRTQPSAALRASWVNDAVICAREACTTTGVVLPGGSVAMVATAERSVWTAAAGTGSTGAGGGVVGAHASGAPPGPSFSVVSRFSGCRGSPWPGFRWPRRPRCSRGSVASRPPRPRDLDDLEARRSRRPRRRRVPAPGLADRSAAGKGRGDRGGDGEASFLLRRSSSASNAPRAIKRRRDWSSGDELVDLRLGSSTARSTAVRCRARPPSSRVDCAAAVWARRSNPELLRAGLQIRRRSIPADVSSATVGGARSRGPPPSAASARSAVPCPSGLGRAGHRACGQSLLGSAAASAMTHGPCEAALDFPCVAPQRRQGLVGSRPPVRLRAGRSAKRCSTVAASDETVELRGAAITPWASPGLLFRMSDPHRPRSDPRRTYFPDDLGFGGPPDAVDSFFRIRGQAGHLDRR